MAETFLSGHIGRRMDVLYERQTPDGFFEGHTENYIKVRARSRQNLRNAILPTRLTALDGEGMAGETMENL